MPFQSRQTLATLRHVNIADDLMTANCKDLIRHDVFVTDGND